MNVQVGQLLEAGGPESEEEQDDLLLCEAEAASEEEYDGEGYEEDDLAEVFDREKDKKLIPSEDQLERWRKARKLGPEFNDSDWGKMGMMKRLVEKLTGHGSCKPFQAMDADPEIPLAWPTDKDADVKMKECEMLAGAMGMASTKLMEEIKKAVNACAVNYQEFSDHKKVMEDPRYEAMMAIKDVQVCMVCLMFTFFDTTAGMHD